MKALAFFSIFVAILLVCGKTIYAQDAVKIAPDIFKVILDNDKVRVLEVHVKPGQKIDMHSHPEYILYVLSDGKMTTTLPNGETTKASLKAGDIRWNEPIIHGNENIGKTEMHALVIEMKTP